MSQAARQTTALLAMAWSALQHTEPTPGTEHTLAYAQEIAERAVIMIPRTGDDRKTKQWVIEKNREWTCHGDDIPSWTPFTMSSMALEIVEDLLSVIRDPAKREYLLPLEEALQALCASYADEDKEEREHYLDARKAVGEMYQVLEFS